MHVPADHHGGTERPKLELADIFRQYGDRLSGLSPQQARVVRAITACRTAALGGHIQQCDHCDYQQISYNSCRNRHCPKCQHLDQVRWVEDQRKHLLPTPYYHLVFTIPNVLHPLFLANRRHAYHLLFAAVAETLQEVALRPKNLGAKIGFSSVVHTWTQTLLYHPHVHCIATGGGLHPDGSRWVSAKPGFLFSVRILSRVFRGKLLNKLEKKLGKMASLGGHPRDLLRKAARKKWVVFSKPPLAGPEQVLKYLGRYTYRIAISNGRLISMNDGKVSFRWKDRAHGDKEKTLTLEAAEFMRRFLLHVVPEGLMRIRHYGLFSNTSKHKVIARCKELLGVEATMTTDEGHDQETPQEMLCRLTGWDISLCPKCRTGHLIFKEELPSLRLRSLLQPVGRAP